MMKNKSISKLTFACLLTTILLLSLFIGTNLLAKPNNPNKPDNPEEDETRILSDFKIWIGNGDLGSPEDVVLRPYGNPPIDYLLKEDYPYWELDWLPYTKKGKGQRLGSWGINLMDEVFPNTQDYCGTYNIANKLGGPGYEEVALFDTMVAHGFSNDLESHQFGLTHVMPKRERVGDYWGLHIGWKVEPRSMHAALFLRGDTNKDAQWEGVYDYNADTWTIPFDSVWCELVLSLTPENTPFGESDNTVLWEGPLSFTVEIQRILND